MYWSSPLVAKAVTLGLVATRPLGRLARRVRRRGGDLPSCDLIWAEELIRARHLTRYQARVLLAASTTIDYSNSTDSNPAGAPLKIGSYVVLDRVGRSDLGATYRCRQPAGRELVAIKVLEPHWNSCDEARAQLVAAIKGWESLDDSRVVSARHIESETGGLALVSGWVAGVSLADRLRSGQRFSPAAASALIRELIAVLANAHAHGLVHGDLKPFNLLISGRGEIRLIDCGVRRAVPDAQLFEHRNLPPNCYDYVAPELAAAESTPDAASDIYAIGCLHYQLITGRPPYFGGNAERKCAAHRAGRAVDPRSLGVEVSHEARRILDATMQVDRSRRVGSYNELMSRLSPATVRGHNGARRELRRAVLGLPTSADRTTASPANRGARRWSKRLFWLAAAAATVAAVTHGSARLLPLLSLNASIRSRAILRGDAIELSTPVRAPDPTTVTALWNATEDLRRAYREAAAHDTIMLKSPGPFLIDAIEINKPITLRGDENVRPLFLGGPGAGLRIAASDVRLENVHFLLVNQVLDGQSRRDAIAMVEVWGDRLGVTNCSFQDVGVGTASAGAMLWKRTAGSDEHSRATLHMRNVQFRNVKSAVSVRGLGGAHLLLENCLHLGPGPLLQSTSGAGKPFEAIDWELSHVTVYGATAADHSFPHPLDEVVPLRIVARNCFLIPQNCDQPVLAVRYAVQPAMLMPKVSWSGSDTACPADATLLEVTRGPDASSWRTTGVAAWQKYWGTHATGLLGVRLPFAAVPPAGPSDIPVPAISDGSNFGADGSRLWYPAPITLEQLPLLIDRLRPN